MDGTLKERVLLNHIIVFYNVFPVKAATRILFFKLEEIFWPMLKTFLVYLSYMPEDKIESINGKEIKTTDIPMDRGIIERLRKSTRMPTLNTVIKQLPEEIYTLYFGFSVFLQ